MTFAAILSSLAWGALVVIVALSARSFLSRVDISRVLGDVQERSYEVLVPRRLTRWFERRRQAERRREFDQAVLDWIDLLHMAAAAGMNLSDSLRVTAPLTREPLREVLIHIQVRVEAGFSLLELIRSEMEERGEQVSAQVAHLLSDSSRRGLPLRSALLTLRNEMIHRKRHLARSRLKTMSLKITIGTILFLFPPVFVVIVLPSLLAFFSW